MGVTIRPRQGQQQYRSRKTALVPHVLAERMKPEPLLATNGSSQKHPTFQIKSPSFNCSALLSKLRAVITKPDLKSRFPFGDNPLESPTLKAWHSELKNERPNPVLLQYLQDHHEKIMNSQVWKNFSKGAFSELRVELILKQLQELNPSEFAYRRTSAFSFDDLIGIDFFLQIKIADQDYYIPVQVKSSQDSVRDFLKQNTIIKGKPLEYNLGKKFGLELSFKHTGILVIDGTDSLTNLKAIIAEVLASSKTDKPSYKGKAIIPILKNEYDQLTGLKRNQFLLECYTIIN